MRILRLKRLYLKNFATYKEAELRYDNLKYPLFVSGETGAGKTSILVDGLCAALFGRAYGERREGSFKYAARGDIAEVTLEFEIAGTTYIVNRKIGKLTGHKVTLMKIAEDGSRIALASTVREVEKAIKDIIGLDMEDFLHTVVVRQGEVASLISEELDPKERTSLFQKIFKIEFSKYLERAKKLRKKAERKIDQLSKEMEILEREVKREEEIQRKISEREEELKDLKKEELSLVNEKSNLELQKNLLGKELEILQQALSLAKLKDEIKEVERNLESTKSELIKTVSKAKGLLTALKYLVSRISQMVKEKETVEKELKSIQRDLDSIRKEVFETETNLNSLKKFVNRPNEIKDYLERGIKHHILELLDMEKEWAEFSYFLESMTEDRKRVQDAIIQLETDIQSHISAIDQLKSGVAKCPVCLRPLEDVEKHIREHQKEMEIINERLAELKRREAELDKEFDKKIEVFTNLIEEQCKKEINYLEDNLKQLTNKERLLLEKDAALNKRRTEITSQESKLPHLTRTLKIAEEQLKIFGDVKEEIVKDVGEEDIGTKIMEILTTISSLRERIEVLKQETDRKTSETKIIEHNLLLNGRSDLINLQSEEIKKIFELKKNEYNQIDQKLTTINNQLMEVTAKVARVESEVNMYLTQLREIADKKKILSEKRKEFKEMEEEKKALEIIEKRVFDAKGLPIFLLSEYLEKINEYANEYLGRFMNNLSLKINIDSKTNNVVIEVFDDYTNTKRELFTYSGGERTLIGFAIRLAISKVLAEEMVERPKFLIIDEGFGSVSEELREAIVHLISELSDDYEQVIVTSHIQDIRESGVFQQELRIVKENGISKII